MFKRRHASITCGLGTGRIEIDGQRLQGVKGFTLTADTNGLPRLTVDLSVHEIELDGDTTFAISDRARETLIKLGWTPPKDDA
jgi:hypothetical protein